MELVAPISWLPYVTEARPVAVIAAVEAVSDEALMLRYRDGDDGAFRELYARYRAPLLRFTRHLAGHVGDAEEIFQEVWIAVIQLPQPLFGAVVLHHLVVCHRTSAHGRPASPPRTASHALLG